MWSHDLDLWSHDLGKQNGGLHFVLERIFILNTHFIGNHLNVFIPIGT